LGDGDILHTAEMAARAPVAADVRAGAARHVGPLDDAGLSAKRKESELSHSGSEDRHNLALPRRCDMHQSRIVGNNESTGIHCGGVLQQRKSACQHGDDNTRSACTNCRGNDFAACAFSGTAEKDHGQSVRCPQGDGCVREAFGQPHLRCVACGRADPENGLARHNPV